MKEQCDRRLEFLDSGETMEKNIDVMEEVLNELKAEKLYVDTEKKSKKSKKTAPAPEEPKLKKKSKTAWYISVL